jgi:predicted amidohydrolase
MQSIGLIADQVRLCESAGVEILCCPEAILGGLADYAARPSDIAINVERGQLEKLLAPIASQTVATIVGFTETRDDGRLFNAAAVFYRGDVIGLYRKLHPAIHKSVYSPGTEHPVFRIDDLNFGIVICRDSIFPEPARIMAGGGAKALFVPTNNGLPANKGGGELVDQSRKTDIARAKENSLWVVRSDVAGRVGEFVCYGSSGIVSPNGEVMQTAGQLDACLLIADISC